MRKYIVGIIIGAVLAYSGQAVAGTISNVGKKIQAEYSVVVDGKKLEAKAVAVNGTTLTPNRALADAVGYDIEFKNNEVLFTKKGDPSTMNPTTGNSMVDNQIAELNKRGKELIDQYIDLTLERLQYPDREHEIENKITAKLEEVAKIKEKIAELEAQQ